MATRERTGGDQERVSLRDRERANLQRELAEAAAPPTSSKGRGDRGRFAPGTSGNPSGRPKGSRDRKTVMLAELVDGEGQSIVRQLVDRAKAGDPWAVRLAIERLLPRLERRVEVDLPRVEAAGDVAQAVASVIELAAEGSLTIEEAGAFMRLLEQQRKTIETADLAARIELLESQAKEY